MPRYCAFHQHQALPCCSQRPQKFFTPFSKQPVCLSVVYNRSLLFLGNPFHEVLAVKTHHMLRPLFGSQSVVPGITVVGEQACHSSHDMSCSGRTPWSFRARVCVLGGQACAQFLLLKHRASRCKARIRIPFAKFHDHGRSPFVMYLGACQFKPWVLRESRHCVLTRRPANEAVLPTN